MSDNLHYLFSNLNTVGFLRSLTLRMERKLRVFGNMVLRRIFVPRGEEETGKCLRLHIEEPNDLNCSPIIVRVMKSRKMR